MKLNNIYSYNNFKNYKKINEELDDYMRGKTGFSDSLMGRGIISLFKLLKRGKGYLKLSLYKKRYEHELAMGILRAYQEESIPSGSTSTNSTSTDVSDIEEIQDDTPVPKKNVVEKEKTDTQNEEICIKYLKNENWFNEFGYLKQHETEERKKYIVDTISELDCDEISKEIEIIVKETNKPYSNLGKMKQELYRLKKSGKSISKDFENHINYLNCILIFYTRLYEYFIHVKEHKCNDVESVKMLQGKKQDNIKLIQLVKKELKSLPQYVNNKQSPQGENKGLVKSETGLSKEGDKKVGLFIEDGKLIRYNKEGKKDYEKSTQEISKSNNKKEAIAYINTINKLSEGNYYKLRINERDFIKFIDHLSDDIKKDINFSKEMSTLFGTLEKINKENKKHMNREVYVKLRKWIKSGYLLKYHPDKQMTSESFNFIKINEELYYNYNEWIIEEKFRDTVDNLKDGTDEISKKIGTNKHKRIYGDTTKLDWSYFTDKSKNEKIYKEFSNNKELKEKATSLVNKDALKNIQYSVMSTVYHKKSPNSSKLHDDSGGISEQETSLSNVWKKMISGINSKYTSFLYIDELDPYKLTGKNGGGVDNTEKEKKYDDKYKKGIELKSTMVEYMDYVFKRLTNYYNRKGNYNLYADYRDIKINEIEKNNGYLYLFYKDKENKDDNYYLCLQFNDNDDIKLRNGFYKFNNVKTTNIDKLKFDSVISEEELIDVKHGNYKNLINKIINIKNYLSKNLNNIDMEKVYYNDDNKIKISDYFKVKNTTIDDKCVNHVFMVKEK